MNLPLFQALVNCEDDGVIAVSLVECPATELKWQTFNADKKIEKFSITDNDKHILTSVLMLAETPIYRRDADGFEYYIQYSKETLAKMAKKMLKDNTFNNIDLNHDGNILPSGSVEMFELYIKDTERGIIPNGFDDVPDGSLFCTYKVNNDELWNACKDGTFNGFSLEGFFTIDRVEQNNKQKYNRFSMKKIKEMLAKILASFGEVKTDKCVLNYEGEELAEGIEVTDENGEAVEDGDYVAEDGRTITVKDSKVEAIKEAEAEEEETEEEVVEEEVEAEEEVVEEVVEETPAETPEYTELRAMIESLRSEIEALKEQVAEIVNKPAVEPIAEEFSKVVENNMNNKLKKMCEVASYLKK